MRQRLNKRENVWMMKLNAWIPEPELEAVRRIKGDISTSLFVRRALKKAVIEAKQNTLSEGDGTNQTPKAAAVVFPNTTTTTPTQVTNSEEVEV
jgi:hypothetical protein